MNSFYLLLKKIAITLKREHKCIQSLLRFSEKATKFNDIAIFVLMLNNVKTMMGFRQIIRITL